MEWLKQLWNSVWTYLIEKDREQVLKQMIREQVKSATSIPATGLKVVNPPPRGTIKIKKKRKANERRD